MTGNDLKALIKSKGDKIAAIIFDDDTYFFYIDEDDGVLDESCIETIGGVDYIKKKGFLPSSGPIGKHDIPVWTYKPVDIIFGAHVLENADDKKRIDKRIYMY